MEQSIESVKRTVDDFSGLITELEAAVTAFTGSGGPLERQTSDSITALRNYNLGTLAADAALYARFLSQGDSRRAEEVLARITEAESPGLNLAIGNAYQALPPEAKKRVHRGKTFESIVEHKQSYLTRLEEFTSKTA